MFKITYYLNILNGKFFEDIDIFMPTNVTNKITAVCALKDVAVESTLDRRPYIVLSNYCLDPEDDNKQFVIKDYV